MTNEQVVHKIFVGAGLPLPPPPSSAVVAATVVAPADDGPDDGTGTPVAHIERREPGSDKRTNTTVSATASTDRRKTMTTAPTDRTATTDRAPIPRQSSTSRHGRTTGPDPTDTTQDLAFEIHTDDAPPPGSTGRTSSHVPSPLIPLSPSQILSRLAVGEQARQSGGASAIPSTPARGGARAQQNDGGERVMGTPKRALNGSEEYDGGEPTATMILSALRSLKVLPRVFCWC